nr:uncharacterized protein CI109_002284 [Kwoniella shandongensis]KAA5529391.1 hypothetical protein CI109_002284 [Kwoniella shandongensis]
MLITDIARYLLPAFFHSSLLPSSISSPSSKINIVPLPAHSTTGDGSTPLCLSHNFTIYLDEASLRPHVSPKDLVLAIEDTRAQLASLAMTYLSPSHGDEFFPRGDSKCERYLERLDVHMSDYDGSTIFDQAILSVEERPELEAYHLDIPLTGHAKIIAKGPLGAYRALTSFQTLWYTHSSEGEGEGSGRVVYAPFAPYEIDDKPAFGWRAVLLDTSRNYFSVDSIYKILETMSMVKLNVFHWHITDSNSWPLVLTSFPELAREGAYSPKEIYTEQVVEDIISYAGQRGIDVLLEIDTPGHTAAIALSHPEHIACFLSTPYKHFAHQPPAGQLRFANQETTEFTSAILSDVVDLAKSRYLSTGGDEINSNCMLEDKDTKDALTMNGWDLDDALDDFTKKTHATLREKGVTPVVWQEMASCPS